MDSNNEIISKNDVIQEMESNVPNLSTDFLQAQKILKQCSAGSGDCLFDHLAEVIQNVLRDRPVNLMDYFEEYSRKIREMKFRYGENSLKDAQILEDDVEKARIVINEYQKLIHLDKIDSERLNDFPSLFLIKPILNLIGIGIHDSDAFKLTLSQVQFLRDTNVKSCRFWGKCFGMKGNYWIFEIQLTDDAIKARNGHIKDSNISIQDEIGGESSKSEFNSNHNTPLDNLGHGINQFLYYASSKPFGDTWHELPLATPNHISVSRQIKKVLTGDLNHKIISYPKFYGTEGNLLRSLITRITSNTFVAPFNYWITCKKQINIHHEEEEVTTPPTQRNNEYKSHSYQDLLDLNQWTHIRPFIESNGTVKDEIENIPCTKDVLTDNTPAWTMKSIHNSNPVNAVTLLRSNVWPGAFAFACDNVTDMIYVGWGQKYCSRNYSPPNVPQMCEEYPLGPDITEMHDMCVEDETIKDDEESEEDYE